MNSDRKGPDQSIDREWIATKERLPQEDQLVLVKYSQSPEVTFSGVWHSSRLTEPAWFIFTKHTKTSLPPDYWSIIDGETIEVFSRSDREKRREQTYYGWILTKEKTPPDDRVVLLGHWRHGCTKLSFGWYLKHSEDLYYQWISFDSAGMRQVEAPDVWASIPQNFKGQKRDG